VSTPRWATVHLVWNGRSLSKTSCAVSFVEQGEEIATFQERYRTAGCVCSSDQSGLPAYRL